MSKGSKLRACPALGRDISSADCGEKRQSQLSCPPDCVHNPFAPAHYSQVLEIEGRLDGKTFERLAQSALDYEWMDQGLPEAKRQGNIATHAFFAWNLFFATAVDPATFAQRWVKSGLTELKNDERVLLRSKMQMRIALLEIHRVFDSERIEAVDLLSPNPVPMIFRDRSLAKMAVRFTTLLSWIFPMPHYWRMNGTAMPMTDVAELTAPEIIREIVQHLGGPVTEPKMRRWLAEHFLDVVTAQNAVVQLRRRQRLDGMDAKFGKAVYELRAPFAKCRTCLEESPDVEPDNLTDSENDEGFATAFAWFDRSADVRKPLLPDSNQVLGRILIGQSQWRLQCLGVEKMGRLRRQFEQLLGDRVRFSFESADDLAAQLQSPEPAVDQSLAPPRLLENPDKLSLSSSRVPALPPGMSPQEAESEVMRAGHRMFLENQIPALANHTPPEAAQDPVLRPRLIQLLKKSVRLHDERNLKTGRDDDINWLLRELDLTEIIFDPPPWRPSPPLLPGDPAGLAEPPVEDMDFEVDPNRLPPPPLPDAPFDLDEAEQRLGNALELFELAADAEDEIYASGSTLLTDINDLTLDNLSENDFCFAIPFVLQVWFALVPCGCRAPEISFEDLKASFIDNLRQFEICAQSGSPKKLEAFLQTGPQPTLMLALVGRFLTSANTVPKESRPALEAQPLILALLKSVVEELNEALRK